MTPSQFTAPTLALRRHWWRVQAINSAGTAGPWSSVRRFTPQQTASAPALSAITLTPTSVAGGTSAQGTATLTSAAPAGGAVVTLSSSNTTVATAPASVTVPAGATSVTFAVNTAAVTTTTPVTITGVFGGASRTATLTVTPPPAPATLSAVSVNPTTVTGGTASQGTITLTSPAPAGGLAVSLSTDSTAATVPASVLVGQGASSATFPIPTSTVTTSTPVTITASAAGVTRTATLTVTPPAQTRVLTVTATGRSGERVTSTPAGINVTVGSTGSAPFADRDGDHPARHQRSRRHLVWGLLERREQDQDLHLHARRQRHRHRQRAVNQQASVPTNGWTRRLSRTGRYPGARHPRSAERTRLHNTDRFDVRPAELRTRSRTAMTPPAVETIGAGFRSTPPLPSPPVVNPRRHRPQKPVECSQAARHRTLPGGFVARLPAIPAVGARRDAVAVQPLGGPVRRDGRRAAARVLSRHGPSLLVRRRRGISRRRSGAVRRRCLSWRSEFGW